MVLVALVALLAECGFGCGGSGARPRDGGGAQAGGDGAPVDGAAQETSAQDAADDGLDEDASSDADADPYPGICTATKWCDPVVEVCIEDSSQPPPPGGNSCGSRWDCYTHFDDTREHPCPVEEAEFCGCDGVTFSKPWFCADRPYDHIGACGDGFSCDSMRVKCVAPEPSCPDGQVAAVVNGCWGACIPFSMCRCEFHWQCRPRDKYRCNGFPENRCAVIPPDVDAGT